MTNTKLTTIRTRYQQACDEVDRTYRLVSSYAEDAERERGFMLDEGGYPKSDTTEADELVEYLGILRREIGTALGYFEIPHDHGDLEPNPF